MADAEQARRLHARGEMEAACRAYASALSGSPRDIQLRHDFAVLLMQMRREREAIGILEGILREAPGHAASATVLSLCFRTAGDVGRGLEIAVRATELAAQDAVAWLLRGSMEVMGGDFVAGERSLRRCLSLEPDLAEAWHYLGEALQARQCWREAADAYRQAMRSQPDEVFNIALCAERAGDFAAAREGFARMCALRPDRADCLARLAQVQALTCAFGEENDTVSQLTRRLSDPDPLAPDDSVEAFPTSFLPMSDDAKRRALRHYASRVTTRAARFGALPAAGNRSATRGTPRIGYISPDFGGHAVGLLLRHLFAAHDRSVVQTYGYSLRRHTDQTGLALRQEFDRFRDCDSMGIPELARTIAGDGIDVLIDLAGYTQGGRPEVLALRPAPVQLGWLGFIHGQEAPWLDAILLDETVLPTGAPWPYSDRVIRLPTPMLPAGPMPPGTRNRKRFGLPEGVPVLASFNNSYKLNEPLVRAWTQILRNAPEARLVLYLPEHARGHFAHYWKRHGGDRQRLLLVDRLPLEEQADRAASCDLFLDAFRYQAGATAVASIAAGLPIVCLEGATPLSRLSVSINRFLAMDDLICGDVAQYVSLSSELANDPERLQATRARLGQASAVSGLFDPRRCAAAIEAACMPLVAAAGSGGGGIAR